MTINEDTVQDEVASLASKLQKSWKWMLALSVALIVLGIIALVDSVAFTAVSMMVFGWILIVAGVFWLVEAVRYRSHRRLYLFLLNAILALVVGITLVVNPALGATVFTMLLGLFFIVTAIFRIVISLNARGAGWAWMLAEGIITLILGILLWAQWPMSGMQIIGIFVGIYLLIVGWSQLMIALAVRAISK